ncbi:uncharacterized protein [Amphiura filiformis]|uniref:uncharacterized protein n=1 Tax=Amphiura filiformis TaxID=82378 RepID=UPI003B20E758
MGGEVDYQLELADVAEKAHGRISAELRLMEVIRRELDERESALSDKKAEIEERERMWESKKEFEVAGFEERQVIFDSQVEAWEISLSDRKAGIEERARAWDVERAREVAELKKIQATVEIEARSREGNKSSERNSALSDKKAEIEEMESALSVRKAEFEERERVWEGEREREISELEERRVAFEKDVYVLNIQSDRREWELGRRISALSDREAEIEERERAWEIDRKIEIAKLEERQATFGAGVETWEKSKSSERQAIDAKKKGNKEKLRERIAEIHDREVRCEHEREEWERGVKVWEETKSKEIEELGAREVECDRRDRVLEQEAVSLSSEATKAERRRTKFETEKETCEQVFREKQAKLKEWEAELKEREQKMKDLVNQLDERNELMQGQCLPSGHGDEKCDDCVELSPLEYNGKTPWKDFIIHFEACKAYNQWTEEAARYQLFTCCKDDALAILSVNDIDPREISYENLVELLQKEFGPRRECAESYFLELKRREQSSGETPRSLARDIVRLMGLVYPEMSRVKKEEVAKLHFGQALGAVELREEVFRARTKTFEEAISSAEAMASFLHSEEERVRNSIRGKEEGPRGSVSAGVYVRQKCVSRLLTVEGDSSVSSDTTEVVGESQGSSREGGVHGDRRLRKKEIVGRSEGSVRREDQDWEGGSSREKEVYTVIGG